MPPHDRLSGRLGSLVRQATQIPRHHEPLLFLYPRWFATAASAPGTIRTFNSGTTTTASQTEPEKELNNAVLGQAKEDDFDSKPSTKLVKKLISDSNMAKKKEGRRRDRLREKYTTSENWRSSFDLLVKHTPEGESEHVKQLERLEMPNGMTGYYEGSLRQLFVEILLTTDCHTQLSREGGGDQSRFRSMDLVGTPTAIKAAKQRLKDAIRLRSAEDQDVEGTMDQYETTSTPIPRTVLRAVWAQNYAKAVLSKPVKDIPMPKEWTILSFANFVEDIVYSNPPRHLRLAAFPMTDNSKRRHGHVDAITFTLVNLFTNPSLLPCISSFAATTAVSFLTHHQKFPEIRSIIEALDTQSYRFTTSIFNACLRAARDASDLHNYSFILRLMISRDCAPDWDTWTSLLALAHARHPAAAKRLILTSMHKKGLLANPQAKTAVAATLVRADFADWVDRGGATPGFLDHYDSRVMCTTHWLDTGVANRMLSIRAARGQFADALDIVSVLRSRGRRPNTVSLNTLVEAAANQGNLAAVLRCLREILEPSNTRVRLEGKLYATLFRMAIRRREYNALRVVWWYACMQGAVSWEMRDAVEKAVIWYAPLPDTGASDVAVGVAVSSTDYADSRLQVFKRFGVKAALGLQATPEQHPETTPTDQTTPIATTQTEMREKMIAYGLQTKAIESNPASSDGVERRVFLKTLVDTDISQYGTLKPKRSFVDMLGVAAEMDEGWKARGVSKNPDFRWIMENVILIPVSRVKTARDADVKGGVVSEKIEGEAVVGGVSRPEDGG